MSELKKQLIDLGFKKLTEEEYKDYNKIDPEYCSDEDEKKTKK